MSEVKTTQAATGFYEAAAIRFEKSICADYSIERGEFGVNIAEGTVDGEWVGIMSAFHIAVSRLALSQR